MINRLNYKDLEKELTQPEVLILLGARQVGKTTLLKKLYEQVKNTQREALYFDLEQPHILASFNCTDEELVARLAIPHAVIFIDEFQYIRNAAHIFKALFDQKIGLKIVCSGSSSIEMHAHLKESLAGRRIKYKIFPLDMREIYADDFSYSLDEYLLYGGLPGIVTTGDHERRKVLLRELFQAYILKDIKGLIKDENIRAFNHLLFLLAQDQGSMISVHSLSNILRVSTNTVNRYLDILEETFVNFRVYSYSNNLGNELKKSTKTYFNDLGIRNSILKDFSSALEREDSGALYETYVFLSLYHALKANMDITFWRTKDGAEVDFVLLKNRKPVPIEVKSGNWEGAVPTGIKRFLARYPEVPHAYVFNKECTHVCEHGHTQIYFVKFEDISRAIDEIMEQE